MHVDDFDGLILFVGSLDDAKGFYVEMLGLAVLFEDGIIIEVGGSSGRVILHRNDRSHDERGILPVGLHAGAASLRFRVADPDAWEKEADQRGVPVLWPSQDATWGRYVVLADPDGRPVVLAKMLES